MLLSSAARFNRRRTRRALVTTEGWIADSPTLDRPDAADAPEAGRARGAAVPSLPRHHPPHTAEGRSHRLQCQVGVVAASSSSSSSTAWSKAAKSAGSSPGKAAISSSSGDGSRHLCLRGGVLNLSSAGIGCVEMSSSLRLRPSWNKGKSPEVHAPRGASPAPAIATRVSGKREDAEIDNLHYSNRTMFFVSQLPR